MDPTPAQELRTRTPSSVQNGRAATPRRRSSALTTVQDGRTGTPRSRSAPLTTVQDGRGSELCILRVLQGLEGSRLAWKGFQIAKGDIRGALLQGGKLQETLCCRPLPQICKGMNMEEGSPMLMQLAAYGLVQAPLHWYKSVCSFLKSLGYCHLKMEPCCWIYKSPAGEVVSVIHSHVDDLMFGSKVGCEIHKGLMDKLKERFTGGSWETGEFVQCGVHVKQNRRFQH